MADLLLHADLTAALGKYRIKRAFNAEGWIANKCAKFNDYMSKHSLKACVVSVSGGVDSAVMLALMMHASRQPQSPIERVVGICQPIHSSSWALERGIENCKAVGAEHIVVDQSSIFDQLSVLVESQINVPGQAFARGQLKSYMRTPVGYYVAQLLSQSGSPAVVMGTGNQDEDGYLAYFCKAGDGVVDVQLISDLHKNEVFSVGAHLDVPKATLEASPSADLWDGQTDEEELGFTYDFVELFTGYYLPMSDAEKQSFRDGLSAEALEQFQKWSAAAERVHRRNQHKFTSPMNL